jgi:hypothetical protein
MSYTNYLAEYQSDWNTIKTEENLTESEMIALCFGLKEKIEELKQHATTD